MDYEFNTSHSSKSVTNSAALFLWISVPFLIFVFLGTVLSLITEQAKFSNAIMALAVSSYGIFIGITIPSQIINHYNRIRVDQHGLLVQVFVFRYVWKYVDWKDVIEVRIIPALDRWGKSQWIIRVRELTYWHKLISRRYGCGSEPGIILTSDLIDREKLLKIVESKLGTK